jgi:G3E family GTPase
VAAAAAAPHPRHSGYVAVSLTWGADTPFDGGALEDLVERLPEAVFRAKGIVRLASGLWAGFHAVGGRLDFDPDVSPPAHGESRIVLLGPGLERAPLAALFASATAAAAPATS